MDWLTLLGFEVIQCKGYFYKAPINSAGLSRKLAFLSNFARRFLSKFGAGYVIVARKRVETLTPIRPSWRSRHNVVTSGLEVEPINRNRM